MNGEVTLKCRAYNTMILKATCNCVGGEGNTCILENPVVLTGITTLLQS